MKHETLHMTMLFDFYGELLTEKQREYFDLYHNEDLSLSEIAEKAHISRHGVYDIIKRAERILIKTEQKTGIVKKWMDTKKSLDRILELAEQIEIKSNGQNAEITNELISIIKKTNT